MLGRARKGWTARASFCPRIPRNETQGPSWLNHLHFFVANRPRDWLATRFSGHPTAILSGMAPTRIGGHQAVAGGLQTHTMSTNALFEISLYQRDNETDEATGKKNPWKFKTFGFFDVLEFRQLDSKARDCLPPRKGRHERTLIVYGDEGQITAALDQTDAKNCYLGVALVKLSKEAAHENFSETMTKLVGRAGDGAVLGCLDAPDLVILKTFSGSKPLQHLIDWMSIVRADSSLGSLPERKLTMVACADLSEFIGNLALQDQSNPEKPSEDDSRARALVRITDKRNGSGLRQLRKLLTAAKLDHVAAKLLACAGYYDVQGITSVPEAAKSGTTREAAGQATGAQLIARTPSGEFVRPLGGGWTRK